MAYQTTIYLKSRFETGDVPTQNDYWDFLESFKKADRIVTLNASGETSMKVRYSGDTSPVLTKTAAGEYTLTIGTGVVVKGFVWDESGATFTGSNSVKLKLTDTDGEYLHGNFTVLQGSTGEEIGQLAGVLIKQTRPTAGNVVVEVPNVSAVSGGFIIVGSIL